ncbi:MAG: phospho-N-acetylmuramoyl-pentapeptide-transferase [Ruminococcaceae bacterium]|nr:phospho-N-acetylmuramoyl-pentapeptide-transferase [Oscillospiraceae bacterium]
MDKALAFVTAFGASAVLGVFLLPLLRRLKFGQSIREIGPDWHKKKSGTPTMGGLMFIAAFLMVTPFVIRNTGTAAVAVCTLLFGVIGFCDDYIKVVKKRNLGLTAGQKFIAQLLVTLAFLLYLLYTGHLKTQILIPFIHRPLSLGVMFIPFAAFVLLGFVNGVNLTDGIDGLAGFVTLAVTLFLSLVAYRDGNLSLCLTCLTVAGGILGFLLFNVHPAKVFMGDTGSLFLGGFVAATAILLRQELLLVLAGIVYVAETLSVILQVASFKLTGKRIFKMSPLHHHFEMCGWSESKIVSVFTAVSVLGCVIGYLGIR